MSDLTTLDPLSPPDAEVVSNGAARMREERSDIIGFAALEHALTGAHKFLAGDGTFPALPGVPAPGTPGRIFLDTTNGRMLRDTGAIWQMLHAVSINGYTTGPGPVNVGTAPTNILSGNANYPNARAIFVFAMVNVVNNTGVLAQIQGQIYRDATPFPIPGLQYSYNLPDTDINTKSLIFWGFDSSGAAGAHTINFSINTNVGTMQYYQAALMVFGF